MMREVPVKKWKVGVVSATGFARNRHMPSYKGMENVELAACCDRNEEALRRTCEEFDIPGRYTGLDSMLEKEELDIVSIVVEPRQHIPLSRRCVEAGRHVLVEKPLSEDYREIVEFRDFLAGRKEKVMVSQNYRFQNPALEMKDVIKSGEIGPVYWVRIENYVSAGEHPKDSPKYKSLFINIGIHEVDMVRYFTDREVEAVFAPRLKVPHAPDMKYPFAEIQVFFEGGVTASARMDWSARGLEEWIKVRVQGEKGVAVCDYPTSPDVIVQRVMSTRAARDGEPERRFHREEKCDDIRKVLNHFIHCIEDDRELDTGVSDHIKTMEIILAAYLSCRESRVVHLPEDRKLLETV